MNQAKKKIFKKGSKTFFNSSLFFPKKIRNDVATLYAFVRTADDFVDTIPQKSAAFYRFKNQYTEGIKGKITRNSIIDEYVELAKRKKFDPRWTEAFLRAMESDLKQKKYETIKQTEEYIYGSAAVIGLMMSRIMGLPKIADTHAASLGKAFQYINFIRDIKEDKSLGRTYFPRTDFIKSGFPYVSKGISESMARENEQNYKKLIRLQIRRYKEWYKHGKEGYTYIPRRYRVAIKTAADMYEWTARKIEKNPLSVFDKKIKPSRSRILLRAIWNVMR